MTYMSCTCKRKTEVRLHTCMVLLVNPKQRNFLWTSHMDCLAEYVPLNIFSTKNSSYTWDFELLAR